MVVLKKKHIRTCSLLAAGIVAASTFFAGSTGEGDFFRGRKRLAATLFALCISYTHM